MKENGKHKKWRNICFVITILVVIFFAFKALLGDKPLVDKCGVKRVYTEMNNYQIFKNVFWHTWYQQPLYEAYPDKYFDRNHYGPFFAVVIAPFAILPDAVGLPLWVLSVTGLLLFAFSKLPFTPSQQLVILLLMINDFANAALNTQINPAIAAMIILAWVYIKEEKDYYATFWIFLGAFIKLYTLVALPLFLFSKHKKRFLISGVLWSLLFLVLPVLFSSTDFVMQSYLDWWQRLQVKNENNIISGLQDMGIGGFFRAVLKKELSNAYFLLAGFVLLALPFLRYSQYRVPAFQTLLLILLLLFPVLFSSSTESPTYVISVAGISIWAVSYVSKAKVLSIFILIIVILFTILSSTDIFPKFLRDDYFYPYRVKSIGVTMVFLYVLVQAVFSQFLTQKLCNK